jgi:hypothetical protein
MAGPGKEYAIGKGRLYFDQFASGTLAGSGERYMGNTPEITLSTESEVLDHFDSDEGLNVKDESVTIENSMTFNLTTDNMDTKNVALWFGADISNTTVASPVTVTAEAHTVRRGMWYQLGVTEARPAGVRDISAVTVTDDAGTPVTIAALGNYEVDLARGRIYIEPDAVAIIDGDGIRVTYTIDVGVRSVMIAKGSEIRGALRYIATNPVGKKRDYYLPYVKMTADGDFALKSEEWMTMSFTCEVLKKDAATERLYIDEPV